MSIVKSNKKLLVQKYYQQKTSLLQQCADIQRTNQPQAEMWNTFV